jgi:hypothetical protein
LVELHEFVEGAFRNVERAQCGHEIITDEEAEENEVVNYTL